MQVIVHGGAGARPENPEARAEGLSRAVDLAESFGIGTDEDLLTDATRRDGRPPIRRVETDGRWSSGFATGHGEQIAEYGLARRVVSLIDDGLAAPDATAAAIEGFGAETGGTGGVIAVSHEGTVGHAHNAEAMGVRTPGAK